MPRSPQPKFVREVAKSLSKLQGKHFLLEHKHHDKELGLDLLDSTKACDYVEKIAHSVIRDQRKKSLTELQIEPNGHNTFPDLRAIFSNGFKVDFEVKSSYSSSHPSWQGASIKKFTEALLERDPYYLNAWFVSFNLSKLETSYRIDSIVVARIWEFCPGHARTGKGHRGLATQSRGSASAEAFLKSYIAREVELGRGDRFELEAAAEDMLRLIA